MTREEYVAEIEKIQTDLLEIGRKVEESIVRAIAALRTRDLEAAKQVIENDDEVDALYKPVFRELIVYMLEEPRNIRGRTFPHLDSPRPRTNRRQGHQHRGAGRIRSDGRVEKSHGPLKLRGQDCPRTATAGLRSRRRGPVGLARRGPGILMAPTGGRELSAHDCQPTFGRTFRSALNIAAASVYSASVHLTLVVHLTCLLSICGRHEFPYGRSD